MHLVGTLPPGDEAIAAMMLPGDLPRLVRSPARAAAVRDLSLVGIVSHSVFDALERGTAVRDVLRSLLRDHWGRTISDRTVLRALAEAGAELPTLY